MNSIPSLAQAAAMRGQPSTVSWSVKDIAARPCRRPWDTSSSGEKVPSEKLVCRWRSATIRSGGSFDDARGAQEFAFDLVENAVDELAAVLGGEFFGDVHGLIDADDGRDVVAVEHFVNGEAEDVAVHGGDAAEFPVLGVLGDAGVGFIAEFQDAADQGVGEEADGGFLGGGFGQFDLLAPGGAALFAGDGGGLLRVPELVQGVVQLFGRIQVVLKQKLHGAFARLTSLAHNADDGAESRVEK